MAHWVGENLTHTRKASTPTSPEANSRLIQPFFELGGWHKEGIKHGHTLGQHGDFQLVLCLQRLEDTGVSDCERGSAKSNVQVSTKREFTEEGALP